MLTRYISYARQNIQPTLTEEAGQMLIQTYVELRRLGQHKRITATPRQLESLIRLSEAHARVRYNLIIISLS